jgi:hypothetical protein
MENHELLAVGGLDQQEGGEIESVSVNLLEDPRSTLEETISHHGCFSGQRLYSYLASISYEVKHQLPSCQDP